VKGCGIRSAAFRLLPEFCWLKIKQIKKLSFFASQRVNSSAVLRVKFGGAESHTHQQRQTAVEGFEEEQ